MPEPPDEPPKSQRSVLGILGERGLRSKVVLPDSDSEHGSSPAEAPATASKLVPQGRGNYRLLGEIARGGMGVILKGHDTDLGRDVAVKVLDGELARNAAIVQRFVEEAQIGGQLQHPGIVPVYELGLMAGDLPYFTMKLVKGRTLAALLAQRETPADDRGKLLAIFESVCQTMAYAHSKGVLHRDLKPANVMVGAFGEVQVVDWGLAKVLRRGGGAGETGSTQSSVNTAIETVRSAPTSEGSNSLAGSVMGTPAYMAPEQAQGEVEKLDERADVFSLGAILCEILTGRPPYVPLQDEPVLVQAGNARLDPARARIGSSGADPALVKLCLDCLTPAREMRPANAAAVARAMHAYLVGVEERARKAEIEAAEERRARKLTLALAGAIVAAIGLGGGGFWLAGRERAKRAELTRNEVESAQGESIQLLQAGKPAEALATARRALDRAQSGGADASLLDRARTFVAKAELDLRAAEDEQALVRQDETLRARLIDLRLKLPATIGDKSREPALDAAFTKAFHDYGVDLDGDDLVPALKRIRERKLGLDVAIALDDWGRLRRRVHGAKSVQVENLYLLAMDLDPDPDRIGMRDAIAGQDVPKLLALASPEVLHRLQPGSIFVLCAALWEESRQRSADVFRIFEQVLQEHPADFALQALAGNFYEEENRLEESLACRTAAVALRPGDLSARYALANSQFGVGRLLQASRTLRAILAEDPTNVESSMILGVLQMLLGDYAGSLATISRPPNIADFPEGLAHLEFARFYTGVLSREEFERKAEATVTGSLGISIYLYGLVAHPDPAQRDPEFVLRILSERKAAYGNDPGLAGIEVMACARVGDWPRALEVVEASLKRPFVFGSPLEHDFLRAVVYARNGRTCEAQTWYRLGMRAWEAETRDQPDVYANSDAMRWRREAESALGK